LDFRELIQSCIGSMMKKETKNNATLFLWRGNFESEFVIL
jgi:hypothetical protein